MRILYVYDGNWPRGATRVAKETRGLAGAGHEVHLLARNELDEPRRESEEWMAVHRLPAIGAPWFNRIVNFPYFFNPFWISTMYRTGRATGADCIVVADLPLAPTAVVVARALGVPVYYDMAEVYPEFLKGLWEFDEMGWSDHLVRNPRLAEWLERWVLRRVDGTLVVSEESKRRCMALGVPESRLTIVGNTPEGPERWDDSAPAPPEFAGLEGRRILLFVGILIGDRGVARAIEAMPSILRSAPDAVLVVVGDGPERPHLEEIVRRLGLQDEVRLLGWREHSTLPQYYLHAHAGLLPFLDGSHVRITLANKLFDYMAAGLPVIASDLPPMRRIVEECGSGVLAAPGDPEALAEAACEILASETRRREMGESGRKAVLERYSWKFDEARMVAMITGSAERAPDSTTPPGRMDRAEPLETASRHD